jgi:hypothetical protein
VRLSIDLSLYVRQIALEKVHFNAELTRRVGQIKISLLLKIEWKQHHILYVKIVANIIWRHRGIRKKKEVKYFVLGKLPGLVVNIKDSQSEPWSSDVGLIPVFT